MLGAVLDKRPKLAVVRSTSRRLTGPLRNTKHNAPPSAALGSEALVVAHRGASLVRAEHTVDAYAAAIASAADGLECDVRLTRDGHLVCVHDRTVNRTSNGTGTVSELDLARLQQLDFSSWRRDWPKSGDDLLTDSYLTDSYLADSYLAGVSPDRDAAGGVLTLETLLGMVADAGRPLRLLVETKHPTRYAGLVEKELVQTLHRFGYGAAARGPVAGARRSRAAAAQAGTDRRGSVAVMSFASIALRRIRLLDPSLDTVLIQERLLPVLREGWLPAGTHIVAVSVGVLRRDPDLVARHHRRGHAVYTFTVDDPDDMDFVLDLGVAAVISNDPQRAVEVRAGRL